GVDGAGMTSASGRGLAAGVGAGIAGAGLDGTAGGAGARLPGAEDGADGPLGRADPTEGARGRT
ncbi:MAG: hypothetical protein ACFCGT_03120, partial [Sandaracinaceae bacterium]